MKKERFHQRIKETRLGTENRFAQVRCIFSKYRFKRILDIGCAGGDFTLELQKVSGAMEAHGIEISGAAAKSALNKGVRAVVLDLDSHDLPYESGYFDAIHCGETIEHLFDPDHLLDEAYRVLATGGIFVITTGNLASYLNRIVLPLGFQPFETEVSLRHNAGKIIKSVSTGGKSHIRVFTFRALKDLLKYHGFTIIRARGTYRPHRSKYLLPLTTLEKVLTFFPSLSPAMIFVVTKPPGRWSETGASSLNGQHPAA